MRKSKWLTRSAGIVLSSGLLLGLSAMPADAAISERHFIHITTKGAPIWEAWADLYGAGKNEPHYRWRQGRTSGGSERWAWTWHGDKGKVVVQVKGLVKAGSRPEGPDPMTLTLDRDYCFQINALGHAKYTGDSKTGNCR